LFEPLPSVISALGGYPIQSKLAATVSASCEECANLEAKLADMTLQIAWCKEQLGVLTKDLEESERVNKQIARGGAGGEREAETGRSSDMIAGVDITGGAAKWLRLL
jgi:hypothetical protein